MHRRKLKQSVYGNGSEWRRWDLHVHTPESKLGASFPGTSWDQYIDSLEAAAKKNEIAVIGVTDYMSVDGYEKLLSVYRDNADPRLQTVKLLIPNIEFRALPSTTDGKALNIHLLVDPSDSQHVQQIKRALKNLKVTYDNQKYGCIRAELIEFARAQGAALGDDDLAYKRGIEQFKPSYEAILEWLQSEGWLKANSLIGISNGKDGISGLPLDGFAATREQLLKNCDFVFSGNPGDRLHYLGQKKDLPPEEIKRLYKTLKPCLHGSDAHEVFKIFKPDDDRFCWIKSDPTFEGLRQVLWEPEARVQISSVMPQLSDTSRVISSLEITDSNGWFTQSSIPLNSGLVAIIGEKGAGKTAIADLVAFASGIAMDPESQSSFVTKGRLHLKGTQVELVWGAGSKTKGLLVDRPHPGQRPLVRYLSQDFVERLCSNDHRGKELQEAIEEVVFSHLDEVNKEAFSSFEELRSSREAASQSRQDEFRGQLASLNREIERLYASLGQRPGKVALKKQTEAQIAELKKQLPSVEGLADQVILKRLEVEQGALTACEQSIAEKNRQRRGVEDFQKSYVSIKVRTERQVEELIETLSEVTQISGPALEKLRPQWDENAIQELSTLMTAMDAEIVALRGDEAKSELAGMSLADISYRVKALQDLLSKDELNRKRLLDLQKQISMQEATGQRLVKEIEELDGKVTKQLSQRERERVELYLKFFSALAEDEQGLKDLYAPMKQALSDLGDEMKFELSAGYHVDTSDWLEKAQRFYDGRKSQALAKRDEIEKFVAAILAPAWKSGDTKTIEPAFKQLISLVSPVEFMDKFASPSPKLLDLFDWMFSTDHIKATYKIKYGGTDLEFLSPGTRGIALLVLYLLMDEDDRRPLVIDQPEGNLDNSSIYLQLVPYIRKAKEKRQIILVTHNPNLVVATDAEQVIVATAERPGTQAFPRITYVSGSLEHSHDGDEGGIRQAVCTLLEGGERAFKEREGRYSIRS